MAVKKTRVKDNSFEKFNHIHEAYQECLSFAELKVNLRISLAAFLASEACNENFPGNLGNSQDINYPLFYIVRNTLILV